MEENMMSISKINFNKEGNDKATIKFTFSDNSEIVLDVNVKDGSIVPLKQKDALVYKAIDENLIKIIDSLIMNIM